MVGGRMGSLSCWEIKKERGEKNTILALVTLLLFHMNVTTNIENISILQQHYCAAPLAKKMATFIYLTYEAIKMEQ